MLWCDIMTSMAQIIPTFYVYRTCQVHNHMGQMCCFSLWGKTSRGEMSCGWMSPGEISGYQYEDLCKKIQFRSNILQYDRLISALKNTA